VTPDHETALDIRNSLSGLLRPTGSHASIRWLRKAGRFAFRYVAPGAGKLTIDWYHVTGKEHRLVARVNQRIAQAGRTTVTIQLTRAGRLLIQHSRRLSLTSNASFAPVGKSPVRSVGKFTLS
jgi:hypothetical protein